MTKLPAGDWLTQVEAARLIGITQPTLSAAVKKNLIPHKRIGRQVLILREDAIRYRDSDRRPGRKKKS